MASAEELRAKLLAQRQAQRIALVEEQRRQEGAAAVARERAMTALRDLIFLGYGIDRITDMTDPAVRLEHLNSLYRALGYVPNRSRRRATPFGAARWLDNAENYIFEDEHESLSDVEISRDVIDTQAVPAYNEPAARSVASTDREATRHEVSAESPTIPGAPREVPAATTPSQDSDIPNFASFSAKSKHRDEVAALVTSTTEKASPHALSGSSHNDATNRPTTSYRNHEGDHEEPVPDLVPDDPRINKNNTQRARPACLAKFVEEERSHERAAQHALRRQAEMEDRFRRVERDTLRSNSPDIYPQPGPSVATPGLSQELRPAYREGALVSAASKESHPEQPQGNTKPWESPVASHDRPFGGLTRNEMMQAFMNDIESRSVPDISFSNLLGDAAGDEDQLGQTGWRPPREQDQLETPPPSGTSASPIAVPRAFENPAVHLAHASRALPNLSPTTRPEGSLGIALPDETAAPYLRNDVTEVNKPPFADDERAEMDVDQSAFDGMEDGSTSSRAGVSRATIDNKSANEDISASSLEELVEHQGDQEIESRDDLELTSDTHTSAPQEGDFPQGSPLSSLNSIESNSTKSEPDMCHSGLSDVNKEEERQEVNVQAELSRLKRQVQEMTQRKLARQAQATSMKRNMELGSIASKKALLFSRRQKLNLPSIQSRVASLERKLANAKQEMMSAAKELKQLSAESLELDKQEIKLREEMLSRRKPDTFSKGEANTAGDAVSHTISAAESPSAQTAETNVGAGVQAQADIHEALRDSVSPLTVRDSPLRVFSSWRMSPSYGPNEWFSPSFNSRFVQDLDRRVFCTSSEPGERCDDRNCPLVHFDEFEVPSSRVVEYMATRQLYRPGYREGLIDAIQAHLPGPDVSADKLAAAIIGFRRKFAPSVVLDWDGWGKQRPI